MFRLTTYGNRGELESAGAAIDQMRLGFSANVWYLDGGWQTLVAGLQGVGREHGATIDALGIMRKAPASSRWQPITVNGMPGLMATVGDDVANVMTFEIVDGRIPKCFIIRNPDKLARVRAGEP